MPALPDSTVGDYGTASSNTAVTKTYAADTKYRHEIASVICSYSGTATGGLTITENSGGTTLLDIDIVAAGEHVIPLSKFRNSAKNLDMVVTLKAGGSGVVGKLTVLGHRLI
jgi:hypothetical protein